MVFARDEVVVLVSFLPWPRFELSKLFVESARFRFKLEGGFLVRGGVLGIQKRIIKTVIFCKEGFLLNF